MGWSAPLYRRAAAIACVCAMLAICARAADAQTNNQANTQTGSSDGFGVAPSPAPTMPVQQSSLASAQDVPQTGTISQSGVQSASGSIAQQGASQLSPMSPAQNSTGQNPAGQNSNGQTPGPAPQSVVVDTPVPTATQVAAPAAPRPAGTPYGFNPMPWDSQTGTSYGMAPLPTVPQPYGMAPLPGGPAGYPQGGAQPIGNPMAYYTPTGPTGYGGPAMSGYILGPGDKLHVSVYGEDDLTGDYQIDSSGLVRLPLIGTMRAAGFTAQALEAQIGGALAQGYLKNPRVNVEMNTYRPIYVMGAVNRPGEYAFVANMTALNAVAFGGGFTDKADNSTVYVRHEGSPTEEELPANQLTRVWPGDVIRVKSTWFWDAMDVFAPLAGPATLAAAAFH